MLLVGHLGVGELRRAHAAGSHPGVDGGDSHRRGAGGAHRGDDDPHPAPGPAGVPYPLPRRPYGDVGPRGRRSHPDAQVGRPGGRALVRDGRLRGAGADPDRGLRRAVPAALGLSRARRQRGLWPADRARRADHAGRHRRPDRGPAGRDAPAGSGQPLRRLADLDGLLRRGDGPGHRALHLHAARPARCRRRPALLARRRVRVLVGSVARCSADSVTGAWSTRSTWWRWSRSSCRWRGSR